jgi:plastocyanin
MTNEATRRRPRLARPLAALAIAALVLGTAACGDDKKNTAGAGGTAGTAATTGGGTSATVITIKNFEFAPQPLNAKPGAEVTVKNDDGTTHTLTADDKSFDTGEVNGGKSAKITLPGKAGTVAYHCEIHDFMKGSIEVTA